MQRERLTVSMDPKTVARVRQCGAKTRGGASAYVERLVRQDEIKEAVEAMVRWYAANPEYVEDSEAERVAMLLAQGEQA